MNVKELRIGNLLTSKSWYGMHPISGIEGIKGGFKVLVKGFWHNFIEGEYCELEAIPLTPLILLKCGFRQLPNEILGPDCFSNGTDYYITGNEGIYQIDRVCDKDFQEWDHISEFEYLHQLQNLYFDVAKDELEITI